jgi:hypothetical protein
MKKMDKELHESERLEVKEETRHTVIEAPFEVVVLIQVVMFDD